MQRRRQRKRQKMQRRRRLLQPRLLPRPRRKLPRPIWKAKRRPWRMLTAAHEAKVAFQRSEHKYQLLTGQAKKGETFEDFQKRKEMEAKGSAVQAAANLKKAQDAAAAAEKEATEAKAAEDKAAAEKKALEGDLDKKKKAQEEAERILREAEANGTAT